MYVNKCFGVQINFKADLQLVLLYKQVYRLCDFYLVVTGSNLHPLFCGVGGGYIFGCSFTETTILINKILYIFRKKKNPDEDEINRSILLTHENHYCIIFLDCMQYLFKCQIHIILWSEISLKNTSTSMSDQWNSHKHVCKPIYD